MRIRITVVLASLLAVPLASAAPPKPVDVADAVDRSLWGDAVDSSVPLSDDATYLRRIMFDIVGRPATPGQLTAFGLNPSENRRTDVINELLKSEDYGSNWTHYWRDAIFRRATNVRAGIVRPAFGEWMAEQLNSGRGWDQITTDLLTYTGPVNDNGAAALLFAHEGVPEEVAAEASRLFMGIQIQCANCHDHPWDSWKREQFHQFTAFFPRVSVRRDRNSDNMFDYEISSMNADRSRNLGASQFVLTRIDRNRDSVITEQEAKGTMLARIFNGPIKDNMDKNGDGKLSIQEITTAQPPDERPGQGATEHYMPDLADPGSQGKKIDPLFFLSSKKTDAGLSDEERRNEAADFITSKNNPWFARAMVNRVWYEMTGTAFYAPIDDIGPDRECVHEETLKILSEGFIRSNYDLKWLIQTIASTRTYQRAPNTTSEGFAHCEPIRLRSDQLYASLCQTLGVTGLPLRSEGRRVPYEMSRMDPGREEFARIFGFDPSTPRDELTGSIPEALFLMNSELLSRIMTMPGANNVITRISTNVLGEEDVVRELYLTMVGREPTDGELSIATEHIASSAGLREGLEDLFWALLNSPEFGSRR